MLAFVNVIPTGETTVELNMTSRCVVIDDMKLAGVCTGKTPTKPTKNSTLLCNRIFKRWERKSGNPSDIPEWASYIPRALKHVWRKTDSGARIYHAARCDADRSLQGIGAQKGCAYQNV